MSVRLPDTGTPVKSNAVEKFKLDDDFVVNTKGSTAAPTPEQPTTAAVTLKPAESEAPKVPTDAGSNSVGMVSQQDAWNSPQPLDPLSFPNPPRKPGGQVSCTFSNVQHMLHSYGICARYNVIKKKVKVTVPGYSGSPDNFDNSSLTLIVSLASLNGMATGPIPSLVDVVADRNQFNPVANWITSKPWDGVNRLPAFYATLVERQDFPAGFKNALMYRWSLSAVAAALMPKDFHSRGVLTIQGPQEIGKSAWAKALVSDPILRAEVVLENHHLDPSNKDTLIEAARHWIVEFGEVDSMFKKDVARLKGFITSGQDKVRVPYARVASEFQRRTVFVATVNDSTFLVDSTGNTRWWTIPVIRVNYNHGIDMQQLYAQLTIDFHKGVQWWLTKEESEQLELLNREHRVVSALRERLMDAIDMNRAGESNLPAMTGIDVLRAIGINNPTNPQCKDCADVLRELFGESKRINGANKWRVPLRYRQAPTVANGNNMDDDY